MSSLFSTASFVARPAHRGLLVRSGLRLLIGLLALLIVGSTALLAQSASEANQIIRSLAPISGQTIAPAYGGQRREALRVRETIIHVDLARSISLEVYFDYDSAKITPRAKAQLAALGEALTSDELRPHRYLIAGHTDAAGSDSYNLDLSHRRARAVRDYMVASFAIDPERLIDVGFGFRRLKRPDAPLAAVNRRVEVLLVVPEHSQLKGGY
jgi:outer membrane protein OmpA-like peptidoglycan-associated protein